MESPVRTSFIPKQTVQTVASTRRSSSVGIFLLIGLFVFFIALVGSGGAFLWKYYLTQELVKKVAFLETQKNALKSEALEEYSRLDTRLTTASALLNQHRAPSFLFDFLEANTISSVRFTSFSYTKNFDPKAEIGSMSLALKGEASGFGSVALQSDLFGKSKVISNPIFNGLSLDDIGRVTFDVKASVIPKEVMYTKKFESLEEVAPVEEVLTEEPALPSEEELLGDEDLTIPTDL